MDRKNTGTARLQSDVMKRLDEFERKGLLTAKMTEHYKKALLKARSNPIKFKLYVEQIQKDLDRINGGEKVEEVPRPTRASPTASTFSSGSSASVSAFTEIASAANSNASSAIGSKGQVSGFSRQTATSSQTSDKNSRRGNQSNISAQSELARVLDKRGMRAGETKCLPPTKPASESRNDAPEKHSTETKPGDHKGRGISSPMVMEIRDASVGEDKTEELFVEMCFFARLGYVQPPCCLRCTYREALQDGNVHSQCLRWVIWRKDTNQLLHPSEMEGNLLMVQCRAAGRLLAGETIEGYAWSPERQEVYSNGR